MRNVGPSRIYSQAAVLLSAVTLPVWPQAVADNPPARKNAVPRAPELRDLPWSIVHRMPRPRSLEIGKLGKRPVLGENQIGIHRLLAAETMQSGGWDTLPNGQRVWRLLVRSNEALSLRLHFRDFHVGDGKVLLFGASDRTGLNSSGAFDGDGPLGTGEFWSTTVLGDEVVIEYQPPANAVLFGMPPFAVDALSHAVHAIRDEPRAPTAAASCNLDVSCYSTYADSARAVARIRFETPEGSFLCTGVLLNTRNSSLIPYFLTNNHCITTQTVANTLETFWNYQTSSCNGASPALPPASTLGATLLSALPSEILDYSFLRLPSTPPDAHYLGWSTTQPSLSSAIAAIGHPKGDYKRIAFGQVDGLSSNKFTLTATQGLTEGGSSGSPWLRSPGVLMGLHARGNTTLFTDPCSALRDGLLSGGGELFSAIYSQISGWLEDGANCTYSAFAALSIISSGGGSSTVAVQTNAACSWTAQSNAGWITLTGTTSASGPGSFGFTVAANPGGARSGTITAGGQTVTITQQGATTSCTTLPIEVGSAQNGTLSPACDSTQRVGSYGAVYTFNGTAGQSIIIEMSSTSIDSFVYLIGPSGEVLASDDDSGGGLNARIPREAGSFTLPGTGTYRIEATTYGAGVSGEFTLRLSAPASTCGAQAIAGGQSINGALSASDCLSRFGTNTYADLYQFTATAGQQVSILLTSPTMDTFLTLISPVNTVLATDDDGGGNLNSRIPPGGTFTIPSNGTYTIEVSTFAMEAGGYTLQLSISGGCSPTPITIGLPVNGTLSTTDCNSNLRGAYADRYTFQGVAGQQIRVDLTSSAFNTYLYLFDPSGQMTAENDNVGNSTNSRIPLTGFLTLPTTGTYTIDASSAARTTGDYTLTITAGNATPQPGMRMVAVTPCRLVDTRAGEGRIGAFGPPTLEGASVRTVPVSQGSCGIPASAKAYVLNITVVPLGPLSYLTVWPAGPTQPLVSTLNSFDGKVVANMAVVPSGTNGSINIFVTDRTDVIVDITGYFAP